MRTLNIIELRKRWSDYYLINNDNYTPSQEIMLYQHLDKMYNIIAKAKKLGMYGLLDDDSILLITERLYYLLNVRIVNIHNNTLYDALVSLIYREHKLDIEQLYKVSTDVYNRNTDEYSDVLNLDLYIIDVISEYIYINEKII